MSFSFNISSTFDNSRYLVITFIPYKYSLLIVYLYVTVFCITRDVKWSGFHFSLSIVDSQEVEEGLWRNCLKVYQDF